jgi:hypothetical protein
MFFDIATVIRNRTKRVIQSGWPVPIFVGDFIPGLSEPRAFWEEGELLANMASHAMLEAPAMQALGIGPKTLETGLELGEEEATRALADPASTISRVRQIASAVRYADEQRVAELAETVNTGLALIRKGAFTGKIKAQELEEFRAKVADRVAGSLPDFAHLLTAEATPHELLTDVQAFEPLFGILNGKATKQAVLAIVPQAEAKLINQVDDRAKQIRQIFTPVLDTFAAGLSYCANGPGFVGRAGLFHIPRNLSPANAAACVIEELAERKEAAYDVVLLNPLPSASVLTTHWASYLSGEEKVQATIFACLNYRSLEQLDDLVKSTELMTGSAAGHFCVFAGFGQMMGRRVPIHAAVAGARRKRDELLYPRGGHFGLLESSFGPSEDKAIFGLEDIDLLALKDGKRNRYADRGINTPAKTGGMIHPFRARSMSRDVELSQYDAVRAGTWITGNLRCFMREVTPGRCNDSTLKAMVAMEATELLNKPFTGKADFVVAVLPGESSDPREFVVELALPELAYVERIKIFVDLQSSKKK